MEPEVFLPSIENIINDSSEDEREEFVISAGSVERALLEGQQSDESSDDYSDNDMLPELRETEPNNKLPQGEFIVPEVPTFSDINSFVRQDNLAAFIQFHINSLNISGFDQNDSLLISSCNSQAVQVVEYLLTLGVVIDYQSQDGYTALMASIEGSSHMNGNHNEELVRMLMAHGANPYLINSNNETAFHLCIKHDRYDVLKIVFEEFKIDPTRIRGENLLIYLFNMKIQQQHQTTTYSDLLMKHGVNIPDDYIDNNGGNILHSLAKSPFPENIDYYLKNDKIDINRVNNEGLTSFLVAVKHSQISNMEKLYSTGKIDLNNKESNCLNTAIKYMANNSIEWIISHNDFDMNKLSVLDAINMVFSNSRARDYKSTQEMVTNILKSTKDHSQIKNVRLSNGNSCCYLLNQACRYLCCDLVSILLRNDKSNIDHCCENFGHSSLSQLCTNYYRLGDYNKRRQFHLICELIRHGADVNINLSQYLTNVLDKQIVSLLAQHEAHFGEDLSIYDPRIWKTLTFHYNRQRNKTNFITLRSIGEIEDHDFIKMHNNICWSISELKDYVIKIVQGVNQYDDNSPYPGEIIWNDEDIKLLRKHSQNINSPHANELIKYINVNHLAKIIPEDTLKLIGEAGSVFSARGEYWEELLKKNLNQNSLDNWNNAKLRDQNYNSEMPYDLSPENRDIMEKLKQEKLYEFMVHYEKLTPEIKNALGQINRYASESGLNSLFKGNECIMLAGKGLRDLYQRVTSWNNKSETVEIINDADIDDFEDDIDSDEDLPPAQNDSDEDLPPLSDAPPEQNAAINMNGILHEFIQGNDIVVDNPNLMHSDSIALAMQNFMIAMQDSLLNNMH